jgi:hypothetical protein
MIKMMLGGLVIESPTWLSQVLDDHPFPAD